MAVALTNEAQHGFQRPTIRSGDARSSGAVAKMMRSTTAKAGDRPRPRRNRSPTIGGPRSHRSWTGRPWRGQRRTWRRRRLNRSRDDLCHRGRSRLHARNRGQMVGHLVRFRRTVHATADASHKLRHHRIGPTELPANRHRIISFTHGVVRKRQGNPFLWMLDKALSHGS